MDEGRCQKKRCQSSREVRCSCGTWFCEPCIEKHLDDYDHRRGDSTKVDRAWNVVKGTFIDLTNKASVVFEEDEGSKWFGIHVSEIGLPKGQDADTKKKVQTSFPAQTTLVETSRFYNLATNSLQFCEAGPKRQNPSLCTFVGETGAGKSTLIRSLIYRSDNLRVIEDLGVPTAGATSGASQSSSTTGEVNLYGDPSTFGTKSPMFFVDCEGFGGSVPIAAAHQRDWPNNGRRYPIKTKDDLPMDRRSAVMTLYPRFLYMFSDVICFVSRNPKSGADTALKLLEWSNVGTENSINKQTLPALIIILNATPTHKESWLEDEGAATKDFFASLKNEVTNTPEFAQLAARTGAKSVEELLRRSFHDIHVHYVPRDDLRDDQQGTAGAAGQILRQRDRLGNRIKSDADRVQQERLRAYTLYDTSDMNRMVGLAFTHLASGSTLPFDWGRCRYQICVPVTTTEHFGQFLSRALKQPTMERRGVTAAVLATSLLRNAILENEKNSVQLTPEVIFDQEIKTTCAAAIDDFLATGVECTFVDTQSSQKCVNTFAGHRLGHQGKDGKLLRMGAFELSDFKKDDFLMQILESLQTAMRELQNAPATGGQGKRLWAAGYHREKLRALRESCRAGDTDLFPSSSEGANVCFGCLFRRPEYRLPCDHFLCVACVEDFNQITEDRKNPGDICHHECALCGDRRNPNWPYSTKVLGHFVGPRILSLDGGGVRGIVELIILQRLEQAIGLDLPLGQFFDLIVGTSAGGVIALGLGAQCRSAQDCIALFRDICKDGFRKKQSYRAVRFLMTFMGQSIYDSKALEVAFKKAFKTKPPEMLNGLVNPCRVAITTTAHQDARLITNYQSFRGTSGRYLGNNISLWHAARCTSAAPMYFDPVLHEGKDCRDGGLKDNNPTQVAMIECKEIWGDAKPCDIILSVGSGFAKTTPAAPKKAIGIPGWLYHLFMTLLDTMNGQEAWNRFYDTLSTRQKERAERLNVEFEQDTEPAFDDLEGIGRMEQEAKGFEFPVKFTPSPTSPIQGTVQTTMIELIADRLRASLFCFDLDKVTQHKGVSYVDGTIYCRLSPGERKSKGGCDRAFKELLARTKLFRIYGGIDGHTPTEVEIPEGQRRGTVALRVPITIHAQRLGVPVRIDVNFGQKHCVAISGFPMELSTILSRWQERGGFLETPPNAAV